MKNGFLKKNSYKNKAFTLACDSEHPPCHPERGSRCECDGADEALIRSTMTLVSGSNKQKTPVSVETLSTHFFLFGSNLAVQKEETGGAQRKKNVGFLPPGKSKICPLASLCSRSQRRLSAFTLAEVLITLAIIGVVAALTIPTVVRNYQKTQTLTQLKKVYSALSNTTNLAIAEHGPIATWDIPQDSSGVAQSSKDFSNKFLIPYLKVSKNCENQNTGSCEFEWNYLNKNKKGKFGAETVRFYLNDGALISAQTSNYINPETGNRSTTVIVNIDVNGQKKPNTYGKDIFRFMYYIYYESGNDIRNGKFLPFCSQCDRSYVLTADYEYACNKNNGGVWCARAIMLDGWQIKDDYPW